jgi:hypothetical protein
LGLGVDGETISTLADGTIAQYRITAPVKVQWKDRSIKLPSIIIPNAKEVLLGALSLEALDLIVDPVRQVLVGAHGDQPMHVVY